MTIASKGDELIITIPRDLMDIVEIQEFIDFLRYRTIVSKSQAKGEEIQEITDQINEDLGKRNNPMT